MSVILGVISLCALKKIKLENVDFETKVELFKNEVSKQADLPKDTFDLAYCGNILDDESTLTSCGVKSGVMVHVLRKKAKATPVATQTMSESDIKALVVALKTFTLSPTCRTALQKLSRPDVLENIIMITPGLSQDPVAISMIQDPELLARMGDIETVRRIVEHHPALAEAANHIAAAVHAETASSLPLPSSSAGLAQFMDMLSEDDEMESSQSSDSVQQGMSRQQSFSAITSAQVAAAIASASQNSGGSGSSGSSGDNSAITPDMVNEAVERAMSAISTPPPSYSSLTERQEPARNPDNLSDQMRQMRELGLTDDAVNLQALQVAGGDVHAAIDLILSGAISNNS